MWHHPRLRDLLIHWSTGAVGASAWGLKAWSVLLGTLCVPATGYLVWVVGASRTGAILAAAILALLAYAERRRPWPRPPRVRPLPGRHGVHGGGSSSREKVTGKRFGPLDFVVRWLVPPLALDPASHPTNTFNDVGAAP
jgi:hypothetical protein